MKILNSPAGIPGESWPGYLLRLSEANGFSGINSIAKILKITNYQLIVSAPASVLLSLNVRCPLLTGRNFPAAPPGSGRIKLGTFGRSIYARVCSKCLKSDLIPYSRSEWDLALQVDCSIHQYVLIDECPQCCSQLNYLRPSIVSCKCGYDLRLCRTKPSINLYSTIRKTFALCEISEPESTTFSASSSQECDALAVILRLVAQALPRPAPGRHTSKIPSSQAFIRAKDLDSLVEWFHDWPNGFIQQVTHSKLVEGKSGAVKLNANTLMASIFPQIHEALIDADARWRRSPRPGKKTVDRNRLIQKELLGVKDMMTLTGRHHNDVIVWLRTGLLGPTVKRNDKSGREVLKVPANQVTWLISLIQQTTTFNDSAQTVGVDPLVLRTLARLGKLPSLRLGKADFTARIRFSDVYEIASKFRSMAALSRLNGQRSLDFSSATLKILRQRRGLISKFFEQLGSKSLPLRVFDKHAVYLDDTYVYYDELVIWIARNA